MRRPQSIDRALGNDWIEACGSESERSKMKGKGRSDDNEEKASFAAALGQLTPCRHFSDETLIMRIRVSRRLTPQSSPKMAVIAATDLPQPSPQRQTGPWPTPPMRAHTIPRIRLQKTPDCLQF
jgi:hypothetical protein